METDTIATVLDVLAVLAVAVGAAAAVFPFIGWASVAVAGVVVLVAVRVYELIQRRADRRAARR